MCLLVHVNLNDDGDDRACRDSMALCWCVIKYEVLLHCGSFFQKNCYLLFWAVMRDKWHVQVIFLHLSAAQGILIFVTKCTSGLFCVAAAQTKVAISFGFYLLMHIWHFTENESHPNLTEVNRQSEKKQNFPQIVIQVGSLCSEQCLSVTFDFLGTNTIDV